KTDYVYELEAERGAQQLVRVGALLRELARHAVELPHDHVDGAPVELPAEDVGEAGERRVTLEQRVARQLAVAVPVEERLRPGRQMIVLILERVRQLVGDQELAHQVAPGQESEEPRAHAGRAW